ncbi:hypothetical protein HHI36_010093 [Cryptolaemus montrouzieri]|uniref:Uncharacterized protein n=1 Tax=Cryptolaemus montrouzieri TaxID=559131 RepID=A0ABD2MHR5_9CUCU
MQNLNTVTNIIFKNIDTNCILLLRYVHFRWGKMAETVANLTEYVFCMINHRIYLVNDSFPVKELNSSSSVHRISTNHSSQLEKLYKIRSFKYAMSFYELCY